MTTVAERPPTARPGQPGSYKWIALSNTTIGVLMASMNSSILLIALPDIFTGIHLNPLLPSNTVYFLWLLMGYMLVTAVLVVSFGRIGDIYGRVRMYNLGFAVFTLFSILLSVTWLPGPAGATWLIAMRILQGVGGAFLMANSSAILTDAFPADQRGTALGINAVAGIAGSFIGLIVGGVLGPVEWRLVFLVSVPFGLFGTVWAYLKLRDAGHRAAAKIDWWGNLTFGTGLTLVLVAITYGIEPYGGHSMGWTNPQVLAEFAAGVVLLALFCWIEMKVADPMFHLSLFRIRAFTAGNLASLLASLGRGGLMFILIIWLQGIWLPQHGYSFTSTPLWAGIYMLPLTAGFLISAPLSGYLSDRFGARPFATGGMIVAAASFLALDELPVNFSYPVFAAILLISGLGMGMFTSPNRAAIMNSLPPSQRGVGAGMVSTFQNAGQVLSIGIYFTLVVIGLSATLPRALQAGLASQGVPRTAAAHVARLPAVSILFAAFLGYNPIKTLLGPAGVLAHLSPAHVAYLTGRSFFPSLIAHPFSTGLDRAFVFSVAAMLVAAAASWLRGGKYFYTEDEAQAEPAAEPVRMPITDAAGTVPAGPGARPEEAGPRPGPDRGDGQPAADQPAAGEPAGEPVAGGAGQVAAGSAGTAPLVSADELPGQIAAWRERALRADPPPVVVTISAAYGAGGSIIGPAVARRLGLPFVDRAIPATVAHTLARPLSDAAGHDDSSGHGIRYLLATMARAVPQFGIQPVEPGGALSDADVYQLTTETVLWQVAATTGGVILGRAATVVLRDHPGVLRVRLSGPAEERAAQASALEGTDETAARCRLTETDQARKAYARQFYGADMSDVRLFDLVIDSTHIGAAACVDIIVTAVTSGRGTGMAAAPPVPARG
jgi:MFS family permease